jgi:hypothetical protein
MVSSPISVAGSNRSDRCRAQRYSVKALPMIEQGVYSSQTRAHQEGPCRWQVPTLVMQSTGLMAPGWRQHEGNAGISSQNAQIAASLAVIQR